MNNNNIFDGYGAQKSVIEAIEELAFACMINGIQPPKAIAFDKESLLKLSMSLKPKERNSTERDESIINQIKTSGGEIKIVEEK